MKYRTLTALKSDRQGATIVEFAMVAPTLLLLLAGVFELGYGMYTQAIVSGAVEQAGRESTLETAKKKDIEKKVKAEIALVAPQAKVKLNWRSHGSYTEIGGFENFTDMNNDGVCNNGEPFEDANGSGKHDKKDGKNGMGKAQDAVVFTVTATYDRIFPLPSLDGFTKTNTIETGTVLRNQPYREKSKKPKVLTCN